MSSQPAPPRELGFWMCTALVVGNTIGMGIFVLPASLAPFGYNALFGWLLVLAGCLVLAQGLARLARTFADADGPYAYIRRTLGDGPAYIAMWCYWVSVWITNAALAIGVTGYLVEMVPALSTLPAAAPVLLLLWGVIGLNLLGVRTGARFQVLTTLLKLLPMLVVMGLGAWLLLSTPEAYARYEVITPRDSSTILSAATIALFAMLGIECATVPAGRVRDPARTVPRATLVGTLLVAGIYIAVSAIPLLLLPQDVLAGSSAPFVLLIDQQWGQGSGRWLGLFVVISGIGALNGWSLLVGQLTSSMATEGVMPAWLRPNNRFGAPARALVVNGLLSTLIVLMSYSERMIDSFTLVTAIVTAAALPMYLMCSLALIVLARRQGWRAARELWVLGGLGALFVTLAVFGMGAEPFWMALGLAAAGLPWYALMRWRQPRPLLAPLR